MTLNNKKYKWYTSCNNVNYSCGFHRKDGHSEWENKQCNNSSVHFSNSTNNAILHCYYLMTTSEESTEEEEKGGDDSQDNYLISLNLFDLLK